MRRSGWGPPEKDPRKQAPRRRPTSTLWNGLAGAVLKEVTAHSACWGKAGPPLQNGMRAQTTLERWQQVHGLLDRGVGLLECARRLQLSLNTVKRYARAAQHEQIICASPQGRSAYQQGAIFGDMRRRLPRDRSDAVTLRYRQQP
jgi:hypothetical protein